jgi:ubiquinone/menaquinone biosynthesis C-methylase UbiE
MPTRLQLEFALAGIALARNWLVGRQETMERIEAELRRLARTPEDEWFDVPERKVSEGYPEWAPRYDDPGNPIVQLEGPIVAALLSEAEPGVAVDAACGTGRHAALLAGRGHCVVGVDGTGEMLELARARLPDVEFRVGSLTSLPLDDESVDLAVCSLAMTHMPELNPAVAELARVVRPSGRLVVSDVHPVFVALGSQAAYRVDDERAGYVRNYVHWPSSYLSAFRFAGLRVGECREILYRLEEVELWASRVDLPSEVVAEALAGLPAVIVWDLARA